MRTGRPKFSFLCTASSLRSNEIQSRFVEFEKEERERELSLFSLALLCGIAACWRSWSIVGMCMARGLCLSTTSVHHLAAEPTFGHGWFINQTQTH